MLSVDISLCLSSVVHPKSPLADARGIPSIHGDLSDGRYGLRPRNYRPFLLFFAFFYFYCLKYFTFLCFTMFFVCFLFYLFFGDNFAKIKYFCKFRLVFHRLCLYIYIIPHHTHKIKKSVRFLFYFCSVIVFFSLSFLFLLFFLFSFCCKKYNIPPPVK